MADERADSFETFYETHIEQLTRALVAALGDPGLAQDAAQESMTRAYQRWNTVQVYNNPTGWCYRVAMNWATSRWRRRRREVLQAEFEPATAHDSISLETDRLQAALRKLSPAHRDVIVLRLIEDWSIEETAAALDVAPGTVQSRYSRALERLRLLLGDRDD